MIADAHTVAVKEWKEHRRPLKGPGGLKMLLFPAGAGLLVASGPRSGGIVLALVLPPFLSVNVLMANVVDAIAGERERHTLATLLSTPLGDAAILTGKLAVALARTLIMVGPTFATAMAVLVVTGRPGGTSRAELWSIAAVVIPVVVLAAWVATLASLRATSIRQAFQRANIALMAPPLAASLATHLAGAHLGALARDLPGGGHPLALLAGAVVVVDVVGLVAVRGFQRHRLLEA